jgi:hypothetical protein
VKTRKSKRKSAIGKSRATAPEIYVKIKTTGRASWFRDSQYARAYIRIKSGEYQYLQWRENNQVRSLYLGRKRQKPAKR